MNTLVTGGAGFVGRHIVKRFLEIGDEVYCVDNITPLTGGISPNDGWPLYDPRGFRNFRFYEEDCRSFFKHTLDDDFDYTFHLAAVVGGRLMIEQNPLAVADDLSIDSEYWQWAVKTRPQKTICFSSSAAYPIKYQRQDNYKVLTEDMIKFDEELGQPDMSYGWAKLTHEYLAKLAFERHGLESVIFRPFSGYGEDQDDSYPFPSICKRAIVNKGRSVLYVWGTGDQMRDFIHIDDCVDGIIKTMDKINSAEAINLSTSIYTSFKQFAKMAAEVCGYSPEVIGLSDKPSGVFARAGDVTKQNKLEFEYRISFIDGITRAIRYYDEHMS